MFCVTPGVAEGPVEGRELTNYIGTMKQKAFPCPLCSSSAVADQELAPQLVSAGHGFNEMPPHCIS